MVYLTRKCEFSASHYYHNPEFSAEENQRIFGKCANLNGHGHNYTLEVTVKGDVDPKTGFVVDLKELKEILNREVLEALDHRHLEQGSAGVLATNSYHGEPRHCHLEAAARQVAGGQAASCARVRIARSLRRFLRGSMKVHLTRRYLFSASHRLHCDELSESENQATYGKCNNPHGHGHNYALEVTVSGQVNPKTGMVCNLVDLDDAVQREVLGALRSRELECPSGIRSNRAHHGKPERGHLQHFEAKLYGGSS